MDDTITTGEVCKRLGYTVNVEFLRSLGLEPATIIKGAVRWRESDWPSICEKIVQHTLAAKGRTGA